MIEIEELRKLVMAYADNFCEGHIDEHRKDEIRNAKSFNEMLDAVFWAGDSQGARNAMVEY